MILYLRNKASAVLLMVAVLAAIFGVWAGYPRHPNLSAFDADAMAAADTAMWRAYYEKRYVALFADLYAVSRDQFGYSPFDSLQIALYAAKAAKTFQPTTSRDAAGAALPDLISYYRLLAKGAATSRRPLATNSTGGKRDASTRLSTITHIDGSSAAFSDGPH